eukprot:gene32713-40283_t
MIPPEILQDEHRADSEVKGDWYKWLPEAERMLKRPFTEIKEGDPLLGLAVAAVDM